MRAGFIDKKRIQSEARHLMARVGLRCAPSSIVSDLSIGQQQIVEIAAGVVGGRARFHYGRADFQPDATRNRAFI